jgi:hypothetical protein
MTSVPGGNGGGRCIAELWANDDAAKVARTLHAALGHMKVRSAGA